MEKRHLPPLPKKETENKTGGESKMQEPNWEVEKCALNEEDHAKLMSKRMAGLELQKHEPVPLTDREAEFFKHQSIAFRGLWGGRIKKGLLVEQKMEFEKMMLQWEPRK